MLLTKMWFPSSRVRWFDQPTVTCKTYFVDIKVIFDHAPINCKLNWDERSRKGRMENLNWCARVLKRVSDKVISCRSSIEDGNWTNCDEGDARGRRTVPLFFCSKYRGLSAGHCVSTYFLCTHVCGPLAWYNK